jgi:pimeloyl-ACP methyl ester carboxylesterase
MVDRNWCRARRFAEYVPHSEDAHYLSLAFVNCCKWELGLGGNADNWLNQRRVFERTRRVLSLDFPGHGQSEGRDVGFRSYWRVIEGLLEHVGLSSTVICGLSKGARAGLALAARRPMRVDRIMVVNAFMHLAPDDGARRSG